MQNVYDSVALETKVHKCDGSKLCCMQFNMYLISSRIKCLFVSFVPKYFNFVMFEENLLAR